MDNLTIYSDLITKGLPVTLSLGVAGIITACLLAILLTIALTSKSIIINKLIQGYLIVFTGTPLLVQIFLIYYGPAQFGQFFSNYLPLLWKLLSEPWFCAYIALVLNSGAYTTQIFYGALKAVPTGQWQACSALGMNKIQTLKVVLPYALKRALSSYSNEIIFVVKSTALASTVTLLDVMGVSQLINGQYYDFSVFIAAGVIYLLINGGLSIIMRLVEKKALAFEN
ncbi:arginine ABC transporter permease ArtM [Orbaceae bacterium ac157xtp]